MHTNDPDELSQEWLEVTHSASWEIASRLHELGVPCARHPYQPLKLYPHTPLALIQTWSVFRQFTQSRSELSDWLDRCWVYSMPTSHCPESH
jgi:hypothetical protein